MTRDDIIRMAREAGFIINDENPMTHSLERFAALVSDAEAKRIHEDGMVTLGHMREQIAAEREACAKVCYEVFDKTGLWAALQLSDKIRARGNT